MHETIVADYQTQIKLLRDTIEDLIGVVEDDAALTKAFAALMATKPER